MYVHPGRLAEILFLRSVVTQQVKRICIPTTVSLSPYVWIDMHACVRVYVCSASVLSVPFKSIVESDAKTRGVMHGGLEWSKLHTPSIVRACNGAHAKRLKKWRLVSLILLFLLLSGRRKRRRVCRLRLSFFGLCFSSTDARY